MLKRIKTCDKKIVLAVRTYCNREKEKKAPIIPFRNVRQRVSAMTGISEKTISNITRESKSKSTLSKRKKCKRLIKIRDNFKLCTIRNKIHEMYTIRKQIPTLSILLTELKIDINLTCGRTSLWNTIRQLGFRFKKYSSKRMLLIEQHDIVAWRQKYLKLLRVSRLEGLPIIFIGETHIRATCTENKIWQIEKQEGDLPSDAVCARWIVAHAGGEMGFITEPLIFKSQKKLGDYRDDNNRANFVRWLQEKLIPNLPPKSLVVLDTVSSCLDSVNKAPTLSSTKVEMQNWLTSKGISYNSTMMKAELFKIIREYKESLTFESDNLLEAHGHKVARLPPYHNDLNVIEYLWNPLKRRLANTNLENFENRIIEIIEEALQCITAKDLKKQCQFVREIENNLFETDRRLDEEIDKCAMELDDESDTESQSSSDSENISDSDY
ncbi:uncharacterized protein LOC121738068 [Aricia agestis]|uniref:uncharacterized protein LOC121738068 n=1 Tax=Aricia agestis TaxID=91739 RepID=UPI001C20B1BD|nr:uncharacterized protein LOC121738068 [Aricia agestis]